ASICAVSQVEMKTKMLNDELGTAVRNYGSEVLENSKVQTQKGTSLTVKNLFYNTPARRNFLKSNQTEFKHIYDTFIRLAISYPDISFSFVNEDEEIFDLKNSDLLNRLIQIYGTEFAETLVEVKQGNSLIELSGFISKPSFTKKTKQDQLLFLNRRYVVSKSLSYSVHLAYGDLIEKGDYPNFFLFLSLDPKKFDVNVHPSKLEVKFEDEKTVFNFVRKSVWNTLEQNDLVVKVNLVESKDLETVYGAPAPPENPFTSGFTFAKHTSHKISSKVPNVLEMQIPINKQKEFEADVTKSIKDYLPGRQTGDDEDNLGNKTEKTENADKVLTKNLIWQFQKKYIMYQLENTLMIIDQHAAHERILYEQALDRLNSNANLSQQLLIPLYVELNPVDYEAAKTIEVELKALGFNVELLSKRKVKINGIPSDVRLGDEEKILQELIDEYKENDVKLNLDKRDNLAKSYACKHAIRTGDVLNENEMLNLIDRLFSMEMPYVCPHGRPTVVKIPIEELDKKFART
ncbi:MAG: DNA mismatch repair endonuclease MutL, partial [Ignavibacteria bacterium]